MTSMVAKDAVRSRAITLHLAASVIVAAAIAATFAFRGGVPGLRHDWVWPSETTEFLRWFFNGASAWQSGAFGARNAGATVNLVLAVFAALAWIGASAQTVLFLFLATGFVCAHRSAVALYEQVTRTAGPEAWLLGAAYAYSPVIFQKLVAGHLYYFAAYALLPLFAYALLQLDTARGAQTVRWMSVAGIAMCIASAQVQFVAFFAFVWLVIAIAHLPRLHIATFGVLAICIALAHDAGLFAGHGLPGISALDFNHATRRWEIDMSAPLSALASFGGYSHYDTQAIGGPLLPLYAVVRWLLFAFACAGLVISLMMRRALRIALPAAVIGAVALLVASGWDGPLRPLFDRALLTTPLFTLIRELYHIMALFVLCACILAAIAIAALPKTFRIVAAAVLCLVGVPFFTGGLARMVPSVSQSAFVDTGCETRKSALLPQWEPLTTDSVASAGIDPASLLPNAATTFSAPTAARAAADMPRLPQNVLAALGIQCVTWRAGVASDLAQTFEPNTGAVFNRFNARERALRAELQTPLRVANARPLVSIEPASAHGALDATLPDAAIPPGAPAAFASSYSDNDIRRSWVSTRLWAWYSPELAYTVQPAVLTKSSTPLQISLPNSRGTMLYLLIAGAAPRVNGRAVAPLRNVNSSPYRWYRWPASGRNMELVLPYGGALADAVDSMQANWTPQRYSNKDMWQTLAMQGTLPHFSASRQLVLAQRFDSGWRLHVAGSQVAAQRVHGLFNGWVLSPHDSGKAYSIVFAPERLARILNVAGNLPLIAAALWLAISPFIRKQEEAK